MRATQRTLPRPDEYSNYWLDGGKIGSAILFSAHGMRILKVRQWFISFGTHVLFEKMEIVYFGSPQEALDRYNKDRQ